MPHLRIKPFPAPVDTQYATNTWSTLRRAVEAILQKQQTDDSFENLYQHAYGMFLHKHGTMLHQSLRQVITQHLESHGLLGSRKGPARFQKTLTKNFEALAYNPVQHTNSRMLVRVQLLQSLDGNFLYGLMQVWEDFSAAMAVIKDVFMYMDRKVDSMGNELPSVHAMGLMMFRDTVLHYGEVKGRLQLTLLDLIARERKGDSVDRSTIKGVCVMLMELGSGFRIVYEEDFEKAFLAESAGYFRAEAEKYLATNNAVDYIRNVERLIQTEGEKTQNYLDFSTKGGIDKLIDEELIEKHMDTVANMPNGGVVSLIQAQNFSEMASMFEIFNRVKDGVSKIVIPISQHLRQQGASLMTDGQNSSKSPVQLVQAVLDLKREYDIFLEKAFKKNANLRRMIATDFEYFFNLNKKAPELLSLYIDEQLKNASKNLTQQQLSTILDQAMTLFRYLHDKDVFERYYKHYLARRLLNARSLSDESEKTMLSKLRHECSYSYTSKLEGMYRDILVSATFNEKFRDHCFQNSVSVPTVELNVQVLTTGFWPMPTSNISVTLPGEAQSVFADFRKLYLEIHNGRQPNLQSNLGTLELAAEFYGPPAINDRAPSIVGTTTPTVRKHILHVTTYQMCVLTLFNRQNEWSYQDMTVATNIPDKDLKRTLATLSTGKLKLLLKLGAGKFTESSTRFVVNENFYSQLYRVKVNAGGKMDSDMRDDVPDDDRRDSREKSDNDRRHEIEAAVIRVMKSHQQLSHNELLAELNVQLRHRFVPTMDLIKQSIESLIVREYLTRPDDNRSVYRYIG